MRKESVFNRLETFSRIVSWTGQQASMFQIGFGYTPMSLRNFRQTGRYIMLNINLVTQCCHVWSCNWKLNTVAVVDDDCQLIAIHTGRLWSITTFDHSCQLLVPVAFVYVPTWDSRSGPNCDGFWHLVHCYVLSCIQATLTFW